MKNLSVVFCLLASLSCAAVSKGESSHVSRRPATEGHSLKSVKDAQRPQSASSSQKESVKSSGVAIRPPSKEKESKSGLLVSKRSTSEPKKSAKAVLPAPVVRTKKSSVSSNDSLLSKVTGFFSKPSLKRTPSKSSSSRSSEGKKKRRSSSASRSAAAKRKVSGGKGSSSGAGGKPKKFYKRVARKVRKMKTLFVVVAISLAILGVVGIGLLVLPKSFRPDARAKRSSSLSSDPSKWCTKINCTEHTHPKLPLYLRQ